MVDRVEELRHVEVHDPDVTLICASDGNHMAEAGIPVVDGCGPAGGGFHSEREFLRLETVEERINMIVNLLKRL